MEEIQIIGSPAIDAMAGVSPTIILSLIKLFAGTNGEIEILALVGGAIVMSFLFEILTTIFEVFTGKLLSGNMNKFLSTIASLISGYLVSAYMFDGQNTILFIFGFTTMSSLLYRFPLYKIYQAIGLDSTSMIVQKKRAEVLKEVGVG